MPYKDPEKQREADRRWRETNPEKAREARRRWREANPEKQREATRRWHEASGVKACERRTRRSGTAGTRAISKAESERSFLPACSPTASARSLKAASRLRRASAASGARA